MSQQEQNQTILKKNKDKLEDKSGLLKSDGLKRNCIF